MTIEEERIESQDYLFMECLRDKKCKRHVNMKTGKNIFGEKHWRAKDEVVNAFDLDEIAFLTGLHKDLVSTSGAKLVSMDFTNTLEWQDEANNDHTFLWYLSDKGKQYLKENEETIEEKIREKNENSKNVLVHGILGIRIFYLSFFLSPKQQLLMFSSKNLCVQKTE